MKLPEKTTVPTMYFIGVTTGKSSIMKLFPKWIKALGHPDANIKGIDIEIHAQSEVYRQVVEFMKNDELSLGALVTTHKIDLYNACKDMFKYLDPYAQMFGEISSISKKDGNLCGHAKDPITSGLALEAFIPENYWEKHKGEMLLLGAGGSGIAIASYVLDKEKHGNNMPSKVYVNNRSQLRLTEIEKIINEINPDVEVEYTLSPTVEISDKIAAKLRPYSLIINATGLGKDMPGSPLGSDCDYPENSLIWEFNYRGELDFMHDAISKKEEKNLTIEDGWIYFIHGWTQVFAQVFHIAFGQKEFEACKKIADEARANKGKKGNNFNWELPFLIDFDLMTGMSQTGESTKRYLSAMKGMYDDDEAFDEKMADGDEVIYEFYELGAPEHPGDLAFGTSIIYPGKVGNEYYMTKGHFHTILDTAEVYYCIQGQGYMLMETTGGEWRASKLSPGKALYVPKGWAHRCINTGETNLVTFFCFRGDAGHDYGTIETKSYRKLIVEQHGETIIIDNPKWK